MTWVVGAVLADTMLNFAAVDRSSTPRPAMEWSMPRTTSAHDLVDDFLTRLGGEIDDVAIAASTMGEARHLRDAFIQAGMMVASIWTRTTTPRNASPLTDPHGTIDPRGHHSSTPAPPALGVAHEPAIEPALEVARGAAQRVVALDVPESNGGVLVGRGASGAVYRCRGVTFHDALAIKMLDEASDWTSDEASMASIMAASPTSPDAVVPVIARGVTTSGRPYLKMPYLPGGSLRDRVERDGALLWRDVVKRVEPIAAALGAAHARQIIHGDVKPANLLFDGAGRLWLSDFGTTRRRGGDIDAPPGFTRAFSPPAVDHEPYDERRDIYGLAATIAYAGTGSASPADWPGRAPRSIRRALVAALSPHAQRTPSVAAFRRQLHATKRPVVVAAALVVALASGTIAVTAWSNGSNGRDANARTTTPSPQIDGSSPAPVSVATRPSASTTNASSTATIPTILTTTGTPTSAPSTGALSIPSTVRPSATNGPCSGSETVGVTRDSITVSVLVALSGPRASHGAMAKAMSTLVDRVNRGEGIVDRAGNKRTLRLDVRDDLNDADRTETLARAIVDEGQTFAVVTRGLAPTLRAGSVLAANCLPQPLSVTATPVWANPETQPSAGGLGLAVNTEALMWSRYIGTVAPLDRVAIVSADDDSAAIALNAFEMAEQSAGRRPVVARARVDGSDLTAVLQASASASDTLVIDLAADRCDEAVAAVSRVPAGATRVILPMVCSAFRLKYDGSADKDRQWVALVDPLGSLVAPTTLNQSVSADLRANGLDPSDREVARGVVTAWSLVELLRAASMDGGLTHSSFIRAMRSMKLINPTVSFEMPLVTSASDPYPTETAQLAELHADGTWSVLDQLSVEGATPACEFDVEQRRCRAS